MSLPAGTLFTKTRHNDTYPAILPSLSNLSGRTVLITGASRGIGRALAVSFTKAKVSGLCIAARGDLSETEAAILSAAKEANIPAPTILSLKVDVPDQESVEEAAKAFSEKFPDGLDVLVNNAGYLEPAAKIHESDPKEWWQTYEVNIKGTYLLCRSFLPHLFQKSTGLKTTVNIVSTGAYMIIPNMSSYSTGKLAIVRFTEFLQAEYADEGIIAFSLHPGGVPTELSYCLPENLHPLLTDTPELPADTVVWLTGVRREFLGGVYVDANWDMVEFEKRKEEVVEKGLLKITLVE